MKGKVLFLVAGTAGYVLGARAGRQRYEQIRSLATRAWDNPQVQKRVVDLEDKATEVARQAGTAAQEKVGAAAGSVRTKVTGGQNTYDPGSASGVGSADEPAVEPLGEQHHTRMPTD